ncbi:MAG: hypothetical protein Q9178_007166 [Gyalolechia marmorata]
MRLWGNCEDIPEWANKDYARDDWRNGRRHIFSMVIMFPDEFSFLRCLERECRKIDRLLAELDDTRVLVAQLPDAFDAYDLSYFREDPYRWSIKLKAWRQNPFTTESSMDNIERNKFVASATANFALLESLQEALGDSSKLWVEWGTTSFDIIDGIKARIEALLYLKEQVPDLATMGSPSIGGQ